MRCRAGDRNCTLRLPLEGAVLLLNYTRTLLGSVPFGLAPRRDPDSSRSPGVQCKSARPAATAPCLRDGGHPVLAATDTPPSRRRAPRPRGGRRTPRTRGSAPAPPRSAPRFSSPRGTPRRPAWGSGPGRARPSCWTGPRRGPPPGRGRGRCACTPRPAPAADGTRTGAGARADPRGDLATGREVGREGLAEFLCIGSIQVDLVHLPVEAERDRFRCFSALDVIGG